MRAVLDACVLYPPSLRDLLLTLAALDAFTPLWSDEILQEVERNVIADHPSVDPAQFRTHTLAAMRRTFPDATTAAAATDHDIAGVRAGDQHVARTARASGADTIVTINLRHFPKQALRPHGIAVLSPGELISDLDAGQPRIVQMALQELAARWTQPPRTVEEIIDPPVRPPDHERSDPGDRSLPSPDRPSEQMTPAAGTIPVSTAATASRSK